MSLLWVLEPAGNAGGFSSSALNLECVAFARGRCPDHFVWTHAAVRPLHSVKPAQVVLSKYLHVSFITRI